MISSYQRRRVVEELNCIFWQDFLDNKDAHEDAMRATIYTDIESQILEESGVYLCPVYTEKEREDATEIFPKWTVEFKNKCDVESRRKMYERVILMSGSFDEPRAMNTYVSVHYIPDDDLYIVIFTCW